MGKKKGKKKRALKNIKEVNEYDMDFKTTESEAILEVEKDVNNELTHNIIEQDKISTGLENIIPIENQDFKVSIEKSSDFNIINTNIGINFQEIDNIFKKMHLEINKKSSNSWFKWIDN